MKRLFYISLLLVPALLLASGGHYENIWEDTDIIPRIFNFVIFAGLLYYLLAEKLRSFLASRQDNIASQLRDIENRLEQAKKDEKNAQALIKENQSKAKSIIADAKKEAELMVEKIAQNNLQEIEIMDKITKEKMELEKKKSIKDAISSILSENINSEDIDLSNKSVVSIIEKKVVA